MPALRNVRRSRRLSQRPPHDPEFEEFDDYDQHDLQLLYPESENDTPPSSSDVSSSPSTGSPAELCPSPTSSSDDEPPVFVPRSSHGRRRKPGHIPRPPNAFMLFRSSLWAKEKIKSTVERDHRQISRIAGLLWNSLSEDDRAPYKRSAEAEKQRHAKLYPEYKYSPVYRKDKSVKRKGQRDPDVVATRCRTVARLMKHGVEGDELERRVKKFDNEGEADLPPSPVIRSARPLSAPSRSRAGGSKRRPKKKSRRVKIEDSDYEDSDADYNSPVVKHEPISPELIQMSPETEEEEEEGFVPEAQIPFLSLSDTSAPEVKKEEPGCEPAFAPPTFYDPPSEYFKYPAVITVNDFMFAQESRVRSPTPYSLGYPAPPMFEPGACSGSSGSLAMKSTFDSSFDYAFPYYNGETKLNSGAVTGNHEIVEDPDFSQWLHLDAAA